MAFTYDLTTSVGQVRLNLGDKTLNAGLWPDGSNFDDSEITQLLTQEGGTVMRAAAAGCEVLANVWASVPSIRVGARSEDMGKVSDAYAKRAKEMRDKWGGATQNFSVLPVRQDGYSLYGANLPQTVGNSLSDYWTARWTTRVLKWG